ncbi:unnamed protein product [Vitrella brassicaformis CCMP3155]|uniref:Uncharacterized protein n=1 Tax=Vitrella brassicaformis (strain CCMP3155) TaxID=1169540 RepID=A0A0G4GF34_VITBC|nr:unnamed protein product [Vitrella brassicaformis CCMP3155]|mmetsp:Transcript_34635/g.85870  ORF Transcript_34635/g.85870 Transcript_34635/m.85870 type:complete len:287 (-) Transcript_34635:569-1429(-)|eukprot:CEM28145.1 unnamed protein product [Vitrella brassicaformis CCMP3155]
MGCLPTKEAKPKRASNFQEALGILCDKRAEDSEGNVDAEKSKAEADELLGKYKPKEGNEWTQKKERTELRKFAMDMCVRESWDKELVDTVFPDEIEDYQMKDTKIPECDEVFAEAGEPFKTLLKLRAQMDEGHSAMVEGCKFGKECKDIKQACANLKEEAKEMQIVVTTTEEGELDISSPDAEGPVATAMESIKTYASACLKANKELPGLKDKFTVVSDKGKELLPKVKDMAKTHGLEKKDINPAVHAAKKNVHSLANLLEVIDRTSDEAKKAGEDVAESTKTLKT